MQNSQETNADTGKILLNTSQGSAHRSRSGPDSGWVRQSYYDSNTALTVLEIDTPHDIAYII